MRERVDLANEVVRETFRSDGFEMRGKAGEARRREIRSAITRARRFVLDKTMSEYVGHLATVPFLTNEHRRADTMDSLRHSAELPFDDVFIEVDNVALRRGLLNAGAHKKDAFGNLLATSEDELVKGEGFLCRVRGHVITMEMFVDFEGTVVRLPYTIAWTPGDEAVADALKRHIPHDQWPLIDTRSAQFTHGITGYAAPQMAVIHDRPIRDFERIRVTDPKHGDFDTSKMVVEFGGVLRYVIAFLATLNATPVTYEEVRPSKGYIGGGLRRAYLSHSVVKLVLPTRMAMKKLAMRAIAIARRGRHEVRGFFRSQPEPGKLYCTTREDHRWSAEDGAGYSYCGHCGLRRRWIASYWRGDAALGYVGKSKYSVEHHKERA